jgi:hypothetical protein
MQTAIIIRLGFFFPEKRDAIVFGVFFISKTRQRLKTTAKFFISFFIRVQFIVDTL